MKAPTEVGALDAVNAVSLIGSLRPCYIAVRLRATV